jgi:hypothetical protein
VIAREASRLSTSLLDHSTTMEQSAPSSSDMPCAEGSRVFGSVVHPSNRERLYILCRSIRSGQWAWHPVSQSVESRLH